MEATFHVDWDLDFESPDDVLWDWLSVTSPSRKTALLEDVQAALELDDERLDEWMEGHSSLLLREGRSYRAWLEHVAEQVRLPSQGGPRCADLPVLSNLLGAYFSLDWDLDFESPDDVLQYWLDVDGTPERTAALVDDVTTWLSWEESRADRFLLACMTWIDREAEYGDRGFLMHVRAVVRDHQPERP